jgi:hypothetical protein
MSRYRLVARFSVPLALVVITAACTSVADPSLETRPESVTSFTTPALNTPGSDLISLLSTVPDTPATRAHALLNDYAEAAAQGGLVRPSGRASEADATEYLTDLLAVNRVGLSVFPDFWGPNVAQIDAWRRELGLSILDADRDIFTGAPEHRYRIILGSVSPDVVDDAVRNDPNFVDLLRTAKHGGRDFYTWSAHSEADLNRRSAARPIGRGGQLAVLDDRVIWTLDEAEMAAALDVEAGLTPSLADFADFRLAALSLEAAGAYTALLTTGVVAAEDVIQFASAQRPGAADDIRRLQAESGFLVRFVALGIGVSLGGDGRPRAVVVLVHDDDGAARENTERFVDIVTNGRSVFTGRPWSQLATVDTVATDGRVTIAVLHTASPGYFLGLLDDLDSLLMYSNG